MMARESIPFMKYPSLHQLEIHHGVELKGSMEKGGNPQFACFEKTAFKVCQISTLIQINRTLQFFV